MNKIILLCLFLLILTYLLFVQKYNRYDSFTNELQKNNKSIRITFLNKKEGYHILNNSNYFQYFNHYDHTLKNYNKKHEYCFHFTQKEKQSISLLLKMIVPQYKACISLFPFQKWKFIKVNGIESNLIHTRDDCIILPQWFIHKIVIAVTTTNKITIQECASTLLHEQIHIYQRKYKTIFDHLYKSYWKLINPSTILSLDNLRNRTNPDGLDIKWLFQNSILPIAIYKNNATSLTDVDIVFLNIKKNNKKKYFFTGYSSQEEENQYTHFFGDKNHYHPNELAALYFEYYFKECTQKDDKNKNKNNKYPQAYYLFNKWIKNYKTNYIV